MASARNITTAIPMATRDTIIAIFLGLIFFSFQKI